MVSLKAGPETPPLLQAVFLARVGAFTLKLT